MTLMQLFLVLFSMIPHQFRRTVMAPRVKLFSEVSTQGSSELTRTNTLIKS